MKYTIINPNDKYTFIVCCKDELEVKKLKQVLKTLRGKEDK